jgi:hypothetical protein
MTDLALTNYLPILDVHQKWRVLERTNTTREDGRVQRGPRQISLTNYGHSIHALELVQGHGQGPALSTNSNGDTDMAVPSTIHSIIELPLINTSLFPRSHDGKGSSVRMNNAEQYRKHPKSRRGAAAKPAGNVLCIHPRRQHVLAHLILGVAHGSYNCWDLECKVLNVSIQSTDSPTPFGHTHAMAPRE